MSGRTPPSSESDADIAARVADKLDGSHQKVIQDLADQAGISFDEMMEAAKNYVELGELMFGGEEFEGVYADDKFWDAYEILTSGKIEEDDRGGIFSCAC